MFKGLRNKFLFLHMGIVTLIIVVFFGTIWVSNYQGMNRRSDEMLSRSAGEPHPQGFNPPAPPRGNHRFSPIFSVVLNEDGSIRKVSSAFSVDEGFYEGITALALSKDTDSAFIQYEGGYFKFLIRGQGLTFLDISNEMQMLKDTGFTFLWIAVPLLLVLFFISLFFANRSIRPVEESYNRQKEFVADASHELKTPLAVITTNIDMLLDGASGEQQKWLYYIKSETGRMASLTENLLFLTRMDYQQEKNERTVFDFSKLLADYLIPLEALFYERKINTRTDIFPNIRIRGNFDQIRRLAGSLIDNAIKYTAGSIRITLEKKDEEVWLTVFNSGRGIPASEINKIWDRFYRGDKSRENSGGFGLGLPIAKSIAERHGGSITAESRENEWTRFTLKLPLEK